MHPDQLYTNRSNFTINASSYLLSHFLPTTRSLNNCSLHMYVRLGVSLRFSSHFTSHALCVASSAVGSPSGGYKHWKVVVVFGRRNSLMFPFPSIHPRRLPKSKHLVLLFLFRGTESHNKNIKWLKVFFGVTERRTIEEEEVAVKTGGVLILPYTVYLVLRSCRHTNSWL